MSITVPVFCVYSTCNRIVCQIMLHENDEYLEESVYLEGIEVYVRLLEALGSATEVDDAMQTVG